MQPFLLPSACLCRAEQHIGIVVMEVLGCVVLIHAGSGAIGYNRDM